MKSGRRITVTLTYQNSEKYISIDENPFMSAGQISNLSRQDLVRIHIFLHIASVAQRDLVIEATVADPCEGSRVD